MGLFDQPVASASPAFNAARIAPLLSSLEIRFAEEGNGCWGDWDNYRAWFESAGEQGEILILRSAWDIRPPLDAYERVSLAANDWNTDHYWPRVGVIRADDMCVVVTDLVMDLETGASDDFLRQQVRCFISTSEQTFEWLNDTFPEHTTWLNVGAPQPEPDA